MAMPIKAEAGESIYTVIRRAINMADAYKMEYDILHNEIVVRVYPSSNERDVFEKWLLMGQIETLKRGMVCK
jgi:hypothetical protein